MNIFEYWKKAHVMISPWSGGLVNTTHVFLILFSNTKKHSGVENFIGKRVINNNQNEPFRKAFGLKKTT